MPNRFLERDLETKNILDTKVNNNFSKLKPSLFFPPLLILILIVLFLTWKDALSVSEYPQVQKEWFYYINLKLSQFPDIIYNLTQVGDALIFLSFLAILIVYAPKIWESLISALLVSAIFSNILKNLFSVPRPAATFDQHSFFIIGNVLAGRNSTPSGHSITIFTVLTVLMFALMPKNLSEKIIWCIFIVVLGLALAFTRVGVGAHYPLDVISGSVVGYISGISGIFISRKYHIWHWIGAKRYYPIFILLFLVGGVVISIRITHENLIIFYFSLISLAISLYSIVYVYFKK